jgi:lipoate-protein ligase A
MNKALIETVQRKGGEITFLSGWNQKCINLGYSQSFKEEVNAEEFNKRDEVVLVRRQGGGGATYLTPEGEISWGIIKPEKSLPDDINKIYSSVCGKIADKLKQIGIEAKHEPINDIVTNKGKISGATIKKQNQVVYIGGTLIYKTDPEEMFTLLTPKPGKKKQKDIEEYRERISTIEKESDASFQETKTCLKQALKQNSNYTESRLTQKEIERAKELANKYRTEEWLYQ